MILIAKVLQGIDSVPEDLKMYTGFDLNLYFRVVLVKNRNARKIL